MVIYKRPAMEEIASVLRPYFANDHEVKAAMEEVQPILQAIVQTIIHEKEQAWEETRKLVNKLEFENAELKQRVLRVQYLLEQITKDIF